GGGTAAAGGGAGVGSANGAVLGGLPAAPAPPSVFVAAAADHLERFQIARRGDRAWTADVAEAAEHLGLARRLQGRPTDAVGSYRAAVTLYTEAAVSRARVTTARLGLAQALDEAGRHPA